MRKNVLKGFGAVALVLALGSWWGPVAEALAPVLAVTPTAVDPGQHFAVTGGSCTGTVSVTVPALALSGSVAASGTWTVTLTAPASAAAGIYPVVADCGVVGAGGFAYGEASITVNTPAPTSTTATAVPASSTTSSALPAAATPVRTQPAFTG
jgi:hypothetical protein